MTEWANPYADLQHALRETVKDRLRRSNGTVTREAFLACAATGREEKAAKLLLRLLHEREDGQMEWKPEIDSRQALTRKLGGASGVRTDELYELWSTSRQLHLRTAFPLLAPAGNKSQHVKRYNFGPQPVYGVDLLVRPLTEFSDDREDDLLRNALKVGDECFALVMHGLFDGGRLVRDGEYYARLVVGNGFRIGQIVEHLIPVHAWRCEQAVRRPLIAGDASGVVDAALPHLQRFAADATRAFYS